MLTMFTDERSLFVSAIVMGLASGLTPGPLSTLAVSQTLRHGPGEGIKVCLAPLVTDLPVIGLAILLLSRLGGVQSVLGLLSIAGALFIFHTAYGNLTFRADEEKTDARKPASFARGFWTSLLSPYAFLFWTSVGSAYLSRAWGAGPAALAVFIAIFYASVLVAKSGIVALAAHARPFLRGSGYTFCIRALGMMIGGFGVKFLMDGIQKLI